MDIEKLKHTLFNVNHLCSHIACSRTQVKKIDFETHKQVYTDVHRLLNIYICSLIDELSVFEKFVKTQDNFYLSDTLNALNPLLDYIKQFDSLRVNRNKLLAHHNRDLKKVFAPWWKELEGKRFASNDEEERMIFSAIKCIHQIFKKRFQKELDEVWQEYNLEIDIFEKNRNEVKDADSKNDIASIIAEVQKRMKDNDFTFTIMTK